MRERASSSVKCICDITLSVCHDNDDDDDPLTKINGFIDVC